MKSPKAKKTNCRTLANRPNRADGVTITLADIVRTAGGLDAPRAGANPVRSACGGFYNMTKNRTHKHKCPKCSFIWEHEDSCVNNIQAHTCRECQTRCWHWDFYPNEKAQFISCAKMPTATREELEADDKAHGTPVPTFEEFLRMLQS